MSADAKPSEKPMTDLIYPAGTAIAFETGEYSDFGYIGHVVTIKELRLRDKMEEFKETFAPKDEWDNPDPRGFLGWLVATGMVFPADVQTVHIGSYGRLELDQ